NWLTERCGTTSASSIKLDEVNNLGLPFLDARQELSDVDDLADRNPLMPVDEVDHRQGVPEPVRVGVGEGVFVLVDPEDGSRHAFLGVEDDDVFGSVALFAPVR